VCEAVTDKRPVNLDLNAFHFPLPAIASISHRISGVALVVGVGILIYMLDQSLTSEASFNALKECMTSFWAKLIIWGVLAALIYHSVAGVKHLVNDAGYGETLEGGQLAAKIVFAVSGVLIFLGGLWIW
jgi:succinate dehydrogenase / fumarate reductase, cytochrome b subunit